MGFLMISTRETWRLVDRSVVQLVVILSPGFPPIANVNIRRVQDAYSHPLRLGLFYTMEVSTG